MEKLTVIFPIAALAFIIWWYWCYVPLLRSEPFSKRRFRPGIDPVDWIAMAAICLVYGVVAFIGLGDSEAPESRCHFDARGRYVVVELPEGTAVGSFRYYSGLYTGSYYVQLSPDGEDYRDVCTLEQGYADLFKWKETPLETDDPTAKYIRIIADSELSLAELAIYDVYGERIDPASMVYNEGCAPLFDEQELIPATSTYKNSTYFDEIYHARTALEHMENVNPYEISHPPLGKIILSLGIRLFGMDPFGWRFMGTLFGILMLPFLYIFIKRLFGSSAVSAAGTVIFAFDFMHFTQTRIATIDTYGVFFIILMYLLLYRFVSAPPEGKLCGERRRYLFLSGLCFGLGCASKWTCVYAGAGLGVLWLLYWLDRFPELRRSGDLRRFKGELLDNILWCLLFFVLVPCVIYYVSYIPYGRAKGLSGISMLITKDYFRTVIDNQTYMFTYHSGVTASHPYSSRWWQWILDARPILYYLEYFDDGSKSAIGAFVNPLLCWGGLVAMGFMAYLTVRERDKKACFILVGYLAQLLPWVFISRITFEYHYFPSTVFLTLALCHVFDRFRRYSVLWRRRIFAFTGASVGLFAAFYPVLSGLRVAQSYTTNFLKWLPSWPF